MSTIEGAYEAARDRYAEFGVDTENAIESLGGIAISIHCWQGDDLVGFEGGGNISEGGIMATGNYPGRSRNAAELRADIEMALKFIPGRHRLNLHAIYAETGGRPVERNGISTEHFANWIDWARQLGIGLDFNPTCFAHPMASSGFTLASLDPAVRSYWIEHCMACRRIGAAMGEALDSPCVTNIWIPDGYKDLPADRRAHREHLAGSLDRVLAETIDPAHNLDAVECKLFGIGSESYVAGSHEFYLGYAAKKQLVLCLDAGHFHPTEEIADKLSAVLLFVPSVLLHVSRGVRWDSDHVVLFTDSLQQIAHELVRGDYLDRVRVGLDFFDASINRVAAWIIGTRSMIKALLFALLEPTHLLRSCEQEGDFTARLALMEEMKTMPFQAVWEHACARRSVPGSFQWVDEIKRYEREVMAARD